MPLPVTVDASDQLPDGSIVLDAAPMPETLAPAVAAYARHQTELAQGQLAGSDPGLYPIRSRVRSSVEPLLGVFDTQLANARNAAAPPMSLSDVAEFTHGRLRGADDPDHPLHAEFNALATRLAQRGTLSPYGFQQTERTIATNRRAAIETAVKPLREGLDALETKLQAGLKDAEPKLDSDAVAKATALLQHVERLTPRHGGPLLGEYVAQLAEAKDTNGAATLLPMLKSMFEDPASRWFNSATLLGLIEATTTLTTTWRQTVARARLERVQRTRHELEEYVALKLAGGTEFTDRDGTPILFPEESPPIAPPMAPSTQSFRTVRLSPERRASDLAKRRQLMGEDSE